MNEIQKILISYKKKIRMIEIGMNTFVVIAESFLHFL